MSTRISYINVSFSFTISSFTIFIVYDLNRKTLGGAEM